MAKKFGTVDDYIASLDTQGRAFAKRLQALIIETVPDCTQAIKYDMPAFQIGGKAFLFLGIWKKHAALYPVYRGDNLFEAAVAPYRANKDTVQFKYRDPLPEALVARIARHQALRTGGDGESESAR